MGQEVSDRGLRRFYTPLRYPGGKAKLANFVKLLLQTNKLHDVHYVEPYAGGAGVALALLFEGYAKHVHINDYNRSVYAFWNSVLNETDMLCALIQDTRVTMSEWKRQKQVQKDLNASGLELGFSTFFLNRTNRSGIIGAGVIGGQQQNGTWKIDARYSKQGLIQRIQKVARFKQRISVYNMDAAEFLRTRMPELPERTFIYLDPPYYVKGEGLYENFYQDQDHKVIAQLVSKLRTPWIVSYDYHPRLLELYVEFESMIYQLSYSAQDRYKGSEVIFFSPALSVPNVPSPAKLPLSMVLTFE